MAITTTFAFTFVANLDLTQGPTTSDPDATSLADGGFAVSGTHTAHTSLDIFKANGTDGGGSNVITGVNSAVDQLSNGNIVIATNEVDSVFFTIKTATGADAVPETDIGDTNSSNPDVAALTGGGFWVANHDAFTFPDFDIDIIIRNNDGSGSDGFSVDASAAQDQFPSVAGLDDGSVAVAWTRTVGANTRVMYAVYTSTGGVIKAPAIVDDFGTVNRNVSVSAKSNGFAIVHEGTNFATGTNDIVLWEFQLNGNFQHVANISNPTLGNDGSDDANASVARLNNNYLAVAYGNNSFADTDTIVKLYDPATKSILASRIITGGESVVDDVEFPTVVGVKPSGIAVFHSNLTDADSDGESLLVQRTSTGDGAGEGFQGDSLVDIMLGNGGNDSLEGAGGKDTLDGGDGNDIINGGKDRDLMTGGPGADRFVYTAANQSGIFAGSRDVITDFTHATDKIRLKGIDAKTGAAGNDTFTFRGTLGFSAEGQVRVRQSGLNTIVELNTTGATGAEMTIQLDGVTATSLSLIDFFF